MKKILALVLVLIFTKNAYALSITADSFENGASMPSQFTCDADNISPALTWNAVPQKTKSLVLICEDPDSPSKVWAHWVIFNIPSREKTLEQNISTLGTFDDGTIQGVNDFGKTGYYGPCPPPGKPHRYFFKLYALDTFLTLDENSNREDVLEALKNHIVEQAEVFGTYQRM